jgi:hypothetical protein
LSYYRATLLAKLDGLSDDQLRNSIVPSGWSPLGLLKHLVYVERRWMQWGFEAEQMSDPRGDEHPSGEGWLVTPEDNIGDLAARLAEIADRTEAIVNNADLNDRAGWVAGSPAIRRRSAGFLSTCYRSTRDTLDIWTWYGSSSTDLSANNSAGPLLQPTFT